jgi:hypothetical protein
MSHCTVMDVLFDRSRKNALNISYNICCRVSHVHSHPVSVHIRYSYGHTFRSRQGVSIINKKGDSSVLEPKIIPQLLESL